MKKLSKILILILITAFALTMLVSCGTPDLETLTKKLEDNGYTVQVIRPGEENNSDSVKTTILVPNIEDVDYVLTAHDYDYSTNSPYNYNYTVIVVFKNAAGLKTYLADEDVTEAKKEIESYGFKVKIVGNAYVIGTPDAVSLIG